MLYEQHFYDNLDRGEKCQDLKNTDRDWFCNCLSYWLESLFSVSKSPRIFAIKTSFEERDNIAVLQRLMASEKYASDIRKAGYDRSS